MFEFQVSLWFLSSGTDKVTVLTRHTNFYMHSFNMFDDMALESFGIKALIALPKLLASQVILHRTHRGQN